MPIITDSFDIYDLLILLEHRYIIRYIESLTSIPMEVVPDWKCAAKASSATTHSTAFERNYLMSALVTLIFQD